MGYNNTIIIGKELEKREDYQQFRFDIDGSDIDIFLKMYILVSANRNIKEKNYDDPGVVETGYFLNSDEDSLLVAINCRKIFELEKENGYLMDCTSSYNDRKGIRTNRGKKSFKDELIGTK